jgi:hypothetical protein
MTCRPTIATLLSFSLLACSMSSSPPPSRGLYGPPHGLAPAQAASAPPPANVAPPAAVANGTLRIDGGSTSCPAIVRVEPDGGATLMCNLARESACVVRRLAPTGFVVVDSERIPGSCTAAAPGMDGSVYIATHVSDRASNIARIDARGRRVASTRLTSGESLYLGDLQATEDGSVVASFSFRKDVAFRGKRLGKTAFSTSGIVKLSPKLDGVTWVHLLDTRKTWIAALLPPTRDGVDAVINTRGPLVEGAPVNPEPDPNTGMFGGNTYGWKAERVAFDRKGLPATRSDLAKPTFTVSDAAQAGDAVALLIPEHKPKSVDVTLLREGAAPAHMPVGHVIGHRLSGTAGNPWLIECSECKFDRVFVGTWRARDTSGRSITLLAPDAMNVSWESVAVRDDHIVVLGSGIDPTTRAAVTLTALAQLPAESMTLDAGRLEPANQLKLAPGCRMKSIPESLPFEKRNELDVPLASCGVRGNAYVTINTHPEGGIQAFSVEGATAKVTACARRVFEPLLVCPLQGNNVSFAVRLKK